MPTSDRPVNGRGRFARPAIVLLAVVLVLYGVACYFAVHQAKVYLSALIAPPGTDKTTDCVRLDMGGLPLRVTAYCPSASFVDPVTGLDVSTGAVRATTFVYNPMRAVFDIASPGKATLRNGAVVETNWTRLESNIGGNLTGITGGTVSIGETDSTVTLPSGGTAKVTTKGTAFRLAEDGPDLVVTSQTSGIQVVTPFIPVNLPPFTATLKATLDGRANVLSGQQITAGEPLQGSIDRLALDFGQNGTLAVSGPFRIAEDGRLSGDLTIDIGNYAALHTTLTASFPQATTIFDTAAILLKSLSPDGKTSKITLNVRDGRVSLGIFPLGVIPPL